MAPTIAKYARSIHLNENTAAPLSQWTIVETLPTEEECEAYLHRQAALPAFHGPGGGGMPIITGGPPIINTPLAAQRCFATDDPRLKAK